MSSVKEVVLYSLVSVQGRVKKERALKVIQLAAGMGALAATFLCTTLNALSFLCTTLNALSFLHDLERPFFL